MASGTDEALLCAGSVLSGNMLELVINAVSIFFHLKYINTGCSNLTSMSNSA